MKKRIFKLIEGKNNKKIIDYINKILINKNVRIKCEYLEYKFIKF